MRLDQAAATTRSNRTDDPAAAQASFDRHLQASRAAHGSGATDRSAVTVKADDTLSGIAHRHGVSMKGLYRSNPQFDPHRQDGVPHFDRSKHGGWDPDYIRPGDR